MRKQGSFSVAQGKNTVEKMEKKYEQMGLHKKIYWQILLVLFLLHVSIIHLFSSRRIIVV